MLAVQFGAGNIGRGFIGSLLHKSGYEIVFVDIDTKLVKAINQEKYYQVILAQDINQVFEVSKVSALNSQEDEEKVLQKIAVADLITTAAGPNALPSIANLLAKGLQKRVSRNDKSLNIIACENMVGGSTELKKAVYKKSKQTKELEQFVGFADATVDRIVPKHSDDDMLAVEVEPFYEWVVDQSMIVGDNPPVQGITYVNNIQPYIERKLYTVNTGHAITAYLGYMCGLQTIDVSIKHPYVRPIVENALYETGSLLMDKYGFEKETHVKYIRTIIQRFENPYITDEVVRVARSPIRKLGAQDRLIGPAKSLTESSLKVNNLVIGIASTLLYDEKADKESIQLQHTLRNEGVAVALYKYSGLSSDHSLTRMIIEEYEKLRR